MLSNHAYIHVYYKSIKREPKIRGIYECRCDERLQTKSLSNPNKKNLEPEPGLVLTLSNWYKTSSNLDVHLPEPGHLHFVQVHFTTDKIRPGSAKIFFSGT